MLDTQYRMHPKIAEFASDAFYGGKVKNGVPESARPTIRGIQWPVEGNGVMLINTAHGQEASDGVSKSNQAEADIVSRIVADVLKAGEIGYNDIGIISPYSAFKYWRAFSRDMPGGESMDQGEAYAVKK